MKLNNIICGDALEVLKTFPDKCIDCVITSPPYWGLRNYSADGQIGMEKTFVEYLQKMLLVITEIKRVLKPSGSFWLNMGDSYGTSSGKDDREGDKQATNRGSLKTGKVAIPGFEKSLLGQPWRMAIAMCDAGWILRSDIKWIKQIYIHKGRYTIGSVMPTSVKDRFNNAGEYLFHFVKNKRYYFDLDAVRIKHQTEEERPPGIDREKDYPEAKRNKNAFNYRVRDAVRKQGQPQFTATKEEIGKYKNNPDPCGNDHGGPGSYRLWKDKHHYIAPVGPKMGKNEDRQEWSSQTPNWKNPNGKNIPNAWLIGTEPSKEAHFAAYPTALCEIPIKTTCPPMGVVLDPFMGSGSTAVMAQKLGRDWLGIELNPAYITIAKKRLAQQILL